MSSSVSQLPPDHTRGPAMVGATWALTTLAIIVVGMRLYNSAFLQRRVGLADGFMALALLFGIINNSIITSSETWGLGHHYFHLTPLQITKAVKFQVIAEPFGIITSILARISVAIYMLNIVAVDNLRRWILHVCLWTNVVINAITITLVLVACQQLASLWSQHVPGQCWSRVVQSDFGYFQGAVNTVIDLIFLVLAGLHIRANFPMPTMPITLKIFFGIVLAIGIFGTASSLVKTIDAKYISSGFSDVTYHIVPYVMWTAVENNAIMIVGSLPVATRSFFVKESTVDERHAMHWYATRPEGQGYVKDSKQTGDFVQGASDGLGKETGVSIEISRRDSDDFGNVGVKPRSVPKFNPASTLTPMKKIYGKFLEKRKSPESA